MKTHFKIQTIFYCLIILCFCCSHTSKAQIIRNHSTEELVLITIEKPLFTHVYFVQNKPHFQETIVPSYKVSASYKESIYYQNLLNIDRTNDVRQNIVNIAKSQIGYCEGNNWSQLSGEPGGKKNYTEYGNWYGMQDEWCAMFVSWCANLAGETNVPKHALCRAGLKEFMAAGTAHSRQEIIDGKYIPLPGDIIYFCTSSAAANGKLTTHVGIVTGYKDGRIYTIEGNTTPNDKSISCGGIVEEKSYKITNTYVAYICELI